MPLFRKKPVVIEAVQFTGKNFEEITAFCPIAEVFHNEPLQLNTLGIRTLEGTMEGSVNDWIIKGVNGEFYPCKPDIFEKTYDPA